PWLGLCFDTAQLAEAGLVGSLFPSPLFKFGCKKALAFASSFKVKRWRVVVLPQFGLAELQSFCSRLTRNAHSAVEAAAEGGYGGRWVHSGCKRHRLA